MHFRRIAFSAVLILLFIAAGTRSLLQHAGLAQSIPRTESASKGGDPGGRLALSLLRSLGAGRDSTIVSASAAVAFAASAAAHSESAARSSASLLGRASATFGDAAAAEDSLRTVSAFSVAKLHLLPVGRWEPAKALPSPDAGGPEIQVVADGSEAARRVADLIGSRDLFPRLRRDPATGFGGSSAGVLSSVRVFDFAPEAVAPKSAPGISVFSGSFRRLAAGGREVIVLPLAGGGELLLDRRTDGRMLDDEAAAFDPAGLAAQAQPAAGVVVFGNPSAVSVVELSAAFRALGLIEPFEPDPGVAAACAPFGSFWERTSLTFRAIPSNAALPAEAFRFPKPFLFAVVGPGKPGSVLLVGSAPVQGSRP